MYKVYNGSSTFPWSPTKKLTTDSGNDITSSITTTADGNIWVVWSSNRNGNYDILYKVYDGVSWSPYNNLTTDPNVDQFPSITQTSNGTIWLTWSTNRNGSSDIYYKTSTNNGTTWSSDTPLPNQSTEDDWAPSIVGTADGGIGFVWVRDDNIYYKTYNGTEWSPDNALTTDPDVFDWRPSIMQASNGDIWVVWDSDRISDQDDIYATVYNGIDWSPDTRLTFDGADDFAPSIMQDINGTIWIAWTSSRLGNLDIYYKTDPPPEHDHDIAIISVTHNPNVTVAYQGLNINIEVVPQNQGMNGEQVQVNCYANSTLIGSQTKYLSAGQLMPINFLWNTTGFAYGNYTIKGYVAPVVNETDISDNTYIDGTVLVTIPGDVNGDRTVDIFDIGSISAHWYPGPPVGPLGYDLKADINSDGAVNIFDIGITSSNLGQSW